MSKKRRSTREMRKQKRKRPSRLVAKDGKSKIFTYEGTLAQHPKGFGFVKVTKFPKKSPPLQRDPFISPAKIAGAQHGDTVLIEVSRIRRDLRPEARVIKIIAHGPNEIGGTYIKKGRSKLVYPDDRRFPFIIRVPDSSPLQPADGDGVIVRFERAQLPSKFLTGEIIEVLGPAGNIDTQMRLVCEQFKLPHIFDDEVRSEVAKINETFELDEKREDLRATAHVTIDGESAKDFDDAICVTKTRKGYRLIVSIADVGHFVPPGSAIDREAYKRGTSIYFPGRVIPMLPEELSNNLCSLIPQEDRFTISAILNFDRTGTLVSKRFCKSIICSHHRFTYTTVKKILLDKNPTVRREHKPFLTGLKWAAELATELQKKRRERGSIDFNIPEPAFTLTKDGEIEAISVTARTFAHQIIEEFMLAANEAVAELLSSHKIPTLYRIHETPESIKAEEFYDFAKTLGLTLPPFEASPGWFAAVLKTCKETRYQYIINNLLLRCMQQAQYSAQNIGHFGLAATHYTHFTSPIRRYPDLIVHREIARLVKSGRGKQQGEVPKRSYKQAGELLSARERTAIMAERDMSERLKIRYMQNRVGDSFDAIISGVTDNRMYVEVQSLCISGSIPLEFLDDDYYILDKKNHRLFGEITANIYQIGDIIRVTVADVDVILQKIQFTLTAEAEK